MDIIKSQVVDLIVNHGIQHKTIIKEIRKALEEASLNLPQLRILYCGSHGGYEYTKEFEEYLNEHKRPNSINHRIDDLKYISDFGLLYITKYPHIEDYIRKYIYYDLAKVFYNICDIVMAKNKINIMQDNYNIVKELKTVFASDKAIEVIPEWDLYCQKKNFIKLVPNYTKEMLLTSFENTIQKYNDKIEVLYQNLENKFTKHVINMMIETYSLSKYDLDERDSFINSLNWRDQGYFDRSAMEFLERYEELLPEFDAISVSEKVGLLFASTQYCNLKIGKVPCLLDWTISEYDGMESIIIS